MKARLYGRRLRRYLWIPIVLTGAAVLTATLLVLHAPPVYRASATVVAKSPASGLEKTLGFADVAVSNTVALKVKQQLGLSETADQLSSKVEVSSGRSNLFTVTASDSDPGLAVKLANTFATNGAALYQELGSEARSSVVSALEQERPGYQQRLLAASKALADFNHAHPNALNPGDQQSLQLQLNEKAASDAYLKYEDQVTQARLEQTNSLRNFEAFVVDGAEAKPDQMRSLLKVAYTAALALVVSATIVLFLEYRDRSVRDVLEVEQMLDVPVIATIPRATRRTLRQARLG